MGLFVHGCSLTNVRYAECTTDAECAAAFGSGSECAAGFCTGGSSCDSGHDCRETLGGGACVDHTCVATIPLDPACSKDNVPPEPPDLFSKSLIGPKAPLLIGSIFSLDAAHDQALTQAVRLAVREINSAGLEGGRQLGVVFCDNGGPNNSDTGDKRIANDVHAIDYLAGTLGVPYLVGPLTSSDTIQFINELKAKLYPTVVISPSATSPALSATPQKLRPEDPYGIFWRTCPNDELQGQVLSENVIKLVAPPIQSVTVIYIHDPYGDGLSQVFQSHFGIEDAHLVPYNDTTPGDPAALAKLAGDAVAFHSDAVLLIALHGEVAIAIMEALVQADPTIVNKPFFFTDGSKDTDLLAAGSTAVQTILMSARGTTPASPSGQDYDVFQTNLMADFGLDAGSHSFLAHAYDATYVGAFGVVHALRAGGAFDGLDVAAGMALLSQGTTVHLNGVNGWISGKGLLLQNGRINIEGTSGHLDFDPALGEAPGRVEVWRILPDLSGYETESVI